MPGKLIYFNLGARGELIRAICYLAKHEYDDHRVEFADLGELKPNLPLGSLPVWEEDGVQFCQSNAILRMLGIRFDMYSKDA